MEIRQLTYFLAVAETLHFARAAESLGLAPSALSMQIQRLERELGARLLARTKRSVTLTSAGKLFLQEARVALAQFEHARRVAARAGRGEAGAIRIGYVISAASCGIVQAILRQFHAQASDVDISLEELSSPVQLQMLEQGTLDICIVRTLVGHPDQVQRFTLGSERIVIAVPSGHPVLAMAQPSIAALVNEPFIAPQFAHDLGFASHLLRIGERAGFVPRIQHHTRDFITALTLVGAGIGVAAIPESLSAMAIPGVAYLRFEEVSEQSQLSMLMRKHETSPVICKLRDVMQQVLNLSAGAAIPT
jgi:DNA-binding transcriptional LysR family regulator